MGCTIPIPQGRRRRKQHPEAQNGKQLLAGNNGGGGGTEWRHSTRLANMKVTPRALQGGRVPLGGVL
eukprot:1159285-Pelagomonas_calceolata.AAC.5